MKKIFFAFFTFLICFSLESFAQIPTNTLVKIVRAEDGRRFDSALENFLKSRNPQIRARAALAAGRIGDEKAIDALAKLLRDSSEDVQQTAIFALGEIESAKASPTVVGVLQDNNFSPEVRARAVEAAGKIAAANPKDSLTQSIGKIIVSTLESANKNRSKTNEDVILAGLTAILRAKPQGGEAIAGEFLNHYDSRIRADALNTLARLRSKNAASQAREFLQKDKDPIVRANAARLLGIGEDKAAVDLLLNAALKDEDSRVRVSAIRSLGSFKEEKFNNTLLERGEKLLTSFKTSKFLQPIEKNELLEIATVLGRILADSDNQRAVKFLKEFSEADKLASPEIETALAKVSPKSYFNIERSVKVNIKTTQIGEKEFKVEGDWKALRSIVQGFGEMANLEKTEENADIRKSALLAISKTVNPFPDSAPKDFFATYEKVLGRAIPDALNTYAKFKTDDLAKVLHRYLNSKDPFIRASAAEVLGDQPASKENIESLKTAFTKSLVTDKHDNDAQLAILDALFKLDKKASFESLKTALNAPNYLVRKKAFELSKQLDTKEFPEAANVIKTAELQSKNRVLPYSPKTRTKLGQILNTNADYIRAVSRKNGTVKAVLTTTKGNFTINFFPEAAPLTVDNFVKLARSNYFNGLEVHRVVPNFVMQDGDPRGDGNGGPGWSIRCEINMLPFERGAVGMALSGKDTGGSQWFITHSPQPHLDGGYTVFGKVNETDMKIVDSIVRGDKILRVKIIESGK